MQATALQFGHTPTYGAKQAAPRMTFGNARAAASTLERAAVVSFSAAKRLIPEHYAKVVSSTKGVFNTGEFCSAKNAVEGKIAYEYGAIYSDSGKLSTLQKWCSEAIWWYQRRNPARFDPAAKDKFSLGKCISGACGHPDHGMLSCSEYALVAIHKLGVIKGIWAGAKRLFLRCNPISHFATKRGWGDWLTDPTVQYATKTTAA